MATRAVARACFAGGGPSLDPYAGSLRPPAGAPSSGAPFGERSRPGLRGHQRFDLLKPRRFPLESPCFRSPPRSSTRRQGRAALPRRKRQGFFIAGIGDCYAAMGRLDLAELSYEEALSLAPRDHVLLLGLASVIERGGDLKRARGHSRRSGEIPADRSADGRAGAGTSACRQQRLRMKHASLPRQAPA